MEKQILNVIFLGKKPCYFDDFLISLEEKIKEGKFFDNRFKEVDDIKYIFEPKPKDFNYISLASFFEGYKKDDHSSIDESTYNHRKMIVVHFGKVPNEILSFVRKHEYIEMNFFSVSSNRIKGKKSNGASGRKVFSYKNHSCKTIFIQNKKVA